MARFSKRHSIRSAQVIGAGFIILLTLLGPLSPHAVSRAKEKGKPHQITMLQLQSEIMSFADRFAAVLWQAFENFESHSANETGRSIALGNTVYSISSAFIIASNPNPSVALLDMIVLSALGRMVYEEHYVPELGKPAEIMAQGFRLLESDILRIAEKVEQNGSEFYRQAAGLFVDPQCADLCRTLANWRAGEKETLGRRRDQIPPKPTGPSVAGLRDYISTHPSVMADLEAFAQNFSRANPLTGRESADDVMRVAIARAEDALAFYRGLKGFVSDPAAIEELDRIITEEESHIRALPSLFGHKPSGPNPHSRLHERAFRIIDKINKRTPGRSEAPPAVSE